MRERIFGVRRFENDAGETETSGSVPEGISGHVRKFHFFQWKVLVVITIDLTVSRDWVSEALGGSW